MPGPEDRGRNQKAVLQVKTGTDEHGEPTLAAPIELDVRWTAGRSQILDSRGVNVALDASAIVDRDIPDGSIMWEGELADWYGSGSNDTFSEHHEVVTSSRVNDTKGRRTFYSVGLRRFRDLISGQD